MNSRNNIHASRNRESACGTTTLGGRVAITATKQTSGDPWVENICTVTFHVTKHGLLQQHSERQSCCIKPTFGSHAWLSRIAGWVS